MVVTRSKYISSYRNGDCIHKQASRYILRGLVNKYLSAHSPTRFFTLPADNFIFEDAIHRSSRVIYTAEINEQTFKTQKELRGDRYNINYGDAFVVFEQLNKKFGFAWFDLCSYLTENIWNNIVRLIQLKRFKNNSIFAITLQAARESGQAQKFFQRLCKKELDVYFQQLATFRNLYLPDIIQKKFEENGYRATLEANQLYTPSTQKGGSMVMYAFHLQRIMDENLPK